MQVALHVVQGYIGRIVAEAESDQLLGTRSAKSLFFDGNSMKGTKSLLKSSADWLD